MCSGYESFLMCIFADIFFQCDLFVVVVVELLSLVTLFVIPCTAAHRAPLSSTISQSLLKFMSIESVMPSNHLILCCPLLLWLILSFNVQSFKSSFFFFFAIQPVGSYLVPWPGIKPVPLQWKRRVLTTALPEKSSKLEILMKPSLSVSSLSTTVLVMHLRILNPSLQRFSSSFLLQLWLKLIFMDQIKVWIHFFSRGFQLSQCHVLKRLFFPHRIAWAPWSEVTWL